MSFGKKKMHAVAAKHSNVIAQDHRGMEFMVITASCFIYGAESLTLGMETQYHAQYLDDIPPHFKPWAKKLLKSVKVVPVEA